MFYVAVRYEAAARSQLTHHIIFEFSTFSQSNVSCFALVTIFPGQASPIFFLFRSLLMFTMENCFYVLISQAVRCLKDSSILPRDKQRLKQELSSELVRRHALLTAF